MLHFKILKMLFREIAKIHAGGLIHGDLHGGNIGIEWDVEGHPIIFIDMSRGGGIENLVGEKRIIPLLLVMQVLEKQFW